MKKLSTSFLIACVVLVVETMGFIYYFYQASSTISNNNAAIATLKGQVSSLQNDRATANSKVASLESQLTAANAQVASLQSQLGTASAQVTTLQSQLSAANAQIATLQNQIASTSSQASSLQTQLTAANAQVATLQSQLSSANSQVSSLQSQNANLQSIVNLSKSTEVAGSVNISQAAGGESIVTSFTANYAGYIHLTGTSTTTTGYIRVIDSFEGYSANDHHYSFGTGTTLIIPILPGNVGIYFGNTDASGTPSATISAQYYY